MTHSLLIISKGAYKRSKQFYICFLFETGNKTKLEIGKGKILKPEMDYDDELRFSCQKTGDPLNKRYQTGLD